MYHINALYILSQHIDAALHLLRRRMKYYKGMFRDDAAIVSIPFAQMALGRWKPLTLEEKTKYIWGDEMMMYLIGDDKQWLQSWAGKEYIYFVLGIDESKHWVTVEVSLYAWQMSIYDCDHSVTPDAVLNEIMGHYTELIPHMMRQSGLFDWCSERLGAQPEPMHYARASTDEVPQTKSR